MCVYTYVCVYVCLCYVCFCSFLCILYLIFKKQKEGRGGWREGGSGAEDQGRTGGEWGQDGGGEENPASVSDGKGRGHISQILV